MAPRKVILLACGCFNPLTNMHLRIFEIAKDHLHRMGTYMVVGGVVSPAHDSYGKKELEASTHRLAMLELALQNHEWVRLSDWECRQEDWSRTVQVLQHHQNQVNAVLNPSLNTHYDINENEVRWISENLRNICCNDPVEVKLLCGGDLLESFGTPGLWADEDIANIVGRHGLVVITRSGSNPLEFIYNSDMLTKYMANITIVTEWIHNEVSSTKIRRALRRSESVKYLVPNNVLDYIYKYKLYGSGNNKYLYPLQDNALFLTSTTPIHTAIESQSSINCMNICNNNLFSRQSDQSDSALGTFAAKTSSIKHPGQAVKIITENSGELKIVRKSDKEVGNHKGRMLRNSQSYAHFDAIEMKGLKYSGSNSNLKECKSCDENLIKFIFTKHGIEVISDVETIV